MTNSLAISLGLLILCGITLDAFLNGGDGLVFLAIKGIDLIEWLAFWR